MKCNLMAWLRKENEDIPAFPIGAPFRPKEVKPLSNPSLFAYGTTKPKEFYASDVKWENEPNPFVIDNRDMPKIKIIKSEVGIHEKPQSAWRTGKPEADGVYKVLSTLGEEVFFLKFENGFWHLARESKSSACKADMASYFQDRRWQPIEE